MVLQEVIKQFMACATACRQKAIRKRSSAANPPARRVPEPVVQHTRPSTADDAKWREREEKAKRKAANMKQQELTELPAHKSSSADDAKWQEREEKAKRKAANMKKDLCLLGEVKTSPIDNDKWQQREELAKKKIAEMSKESDGNVSQKGETAADEAKWKAREERARLRAAALTETDEPVPPRAIQRTQQCEEEQRTGRVQKLRQVYCEFDLDGGGDVGSEELLALGQARRKLGQKAGVQSLV